MGAHIAELEVLAEYRAGEVAQQPATDTDDLAAAIKEFETALPGWWWSVCVCHLTRDASCGPDIAGPDFELLKYREFDEGFHCEDPAGTLATSLRNVMAKAVSAKQHAISTKP